MTPFNHVKVISASTEREHHTRHGLHLNKKGKHWVAENVVKEIRNLHRPLQINPPTVIQWKVDEENITQPIDLSTSIRTCDDMEPPSTDEMRSNGWIIGVKRYTR